MALIKQRTYTVQVAGELIEGFREWTPISQIRADWVKAIPHEDGTLEVWFSQGDEPPKENG